MEKLKKIIVSGGIEEFEYRNVKDDISEGNRRIILIFSLISSAILLCLFVLSFFVSSFASYRLIYGLSLIACLAIYLVAKIPGANNLTVMMIDTYCFIIILLALGIEIGTISSPNEISATYIALLLAVPQIFTDRPWRMYLPIIGSAAVFLCLSATIKDASTYASDRMNTIVFGVISLLLCTYSINTRVSRYYLADRISHLAETDQLTGLKNRYSYQELLDKATVLASNSIYCVFVDVNGLHELNDTKGHEAGDRMLQFVADVMRNLFGKDNTFRIGGDEFVVVGQDKDEASIRQLVATMKQAIEAAGYSVAAGISIRNKEELAMDSVVKDAEEDMYTDKSLFYQKTGKARR